MDRFTGAALNDTALELLREISDKLTRLCEAVENAREPARSLKFKDRAAMAKILPVLAANFLGTVGTWELVDYAAVNDPLGMNLRLVIGKRSAQELGQLFARAVDHEIDGLRLRREKPDANGARWAVANEAP